LQYNHAHENLFPVPSSGGREHEAIQINTSDAHFAARLSIMPFACHAADLLSALEGKDMPLREVFWSATQLVARTDRRDDRRWASATAITGRPEL
jgi:hypothetical protein